MIDSEIQTNLTVDHQVIQKTENGDEFHGANETKRSEEEAIAGPDEDRIYGNRIMAGSDGPEPKRDGEMFSQPVKTEPEIPFLFAFDEPLQAQMERFTKLQHEQPHICARLARRGQLLIQLAKQGELSSFEKIANQCPKDELPYWFIIQAFKEASTNYNANIVVFMLDNGLDLKLPPLEDILHSLVSNTSERDFRLASMIDLLVSRGLDVNHQRRKDYQTALHIACRRGLLKVVKQLVFLGADVNAVAKDDLMPLNCADAFYKEVTSKSDEDHLVGQRDSAVKIREILLRRNARRTWRTDPPLSEEEKKIVRFMEEQEASGAFSGGC